MGKFDGLRHKLGKLRGRTPTEAAGMLFRKLVYRRTVMGVYETAAGDSVAPAGQAPGEIAFLRGAELERALDDLLVSNPHLSAVDWERFRDADPVCVVLSGEDRLMASTWMMRRDLWVGELQRTVPISPGEHFSCRSYVAAAHRGRRLLGHMLHAYASEIAAPTDRLWCVIHDWNRASIRAYERVGWRRRGSLGTIVVLGRKIAIERTDEGSPT